jgi:hypothetical protein
MHLNSRLLSFKSWHFGGWTELNLINLPPKLFCFSYVRIDICCLVQHYSDMVIQLCDHCICYDSHTVKQSGIKVTECSIEKLENVINQDCCTYDATTDLRFLWWWLRCTNVICNVTLYCLVECYWHFGGTPLSPCAGLKSKPKQWQNAPSKYV